jgi:hypothetical protein
MIELHRPITITNAGHNIYALDAFPCFPYAHARSYAMRDSDFRPDDPPRYGAYVCLRVPARARQRVAQAPVTTIAARLGLRNEFEAEGDHPPDALAFLPRIGASPGDTADEGLWKADAVVHIASARSESVAEFSLRVRG